MEPPLEQDGRTGKEPDLRTPLDALSPQMFAPSYELIDRHTAQSPDELENYMRRIPWAGPMILRISQEPHITRVFRVLQPQF